MSGRPPRSIYLAILALALALRLAGGVWWQQRLPPDVKFFFGDSESYWHLARTIATGQPYQYGDDGALIFRTPGFPLLLAPLFALDQDPPVLAARFLCAALGTASVAAVMALANTLGGARVAIVAGVATAIDPGAITLGVFILSEAPFSPLMVLHIWGWVLAWRSNSVREQLVHAGWGGLAAGAATLMRPSWLLFLPFAAAIGLAFFAGRKKQLVILAAMLAACCFTMSPWWLRNYRVTGRFVPTTLQVGPSLYDGLNRHADGSSNMEFVPRFIADQQHADASKVAPLHNTFEERLDRRQRDAAIVWALDHPARVMELAWIKLMRMWSPWPNAGEMGGFVAKWAIAMGYVPLITLALVGAWRFARRDWALALLAIPAIYFSLLHMVFVSSLRYRQPAMLLLAILAALVVVQWWERRNALARRNELITR